MRKTKGKDQYVKAVEYSHALEKLLIMERENSAAIRSELTATERERDELRAEITRRDATVGESVAFTHESEISNMHATGLYLRGFPADRRLNSEEGYTVPLYTAAPPAVFPPASDASQGWKVNPEYLQSVATRSCDADGVNPSLETVESVILALGAQQQKVVELDNLFSINFAGVSVRVILLKDVSISLDAANVKWEVKK